MNLIEAMVYAISLLSSILAIAVLIVLYYRRTKIRKYIVMAESHIKTNNLKIAEKYYDLALIKTNSPFKTQYIKGKKAEIKEQLGLYDEALMIYTGILDEMKNENKFNSNKYSSLLNKVAVLNQKIGNYIKARNLYLYILDINPNCLNDEFVRIHNNLGSISLEMAKYSEAKEYLSKALEKSTIYNNHIIYNNLSLLYQAQGNIKKAEKYGLLAIETKERLSPSNELDTALSYNNMSNIYQDKGEYKKAEEYQLKAIMIRKEILSPKHLDIAISYNNMSNIYHSLGEYEKAEKYQLIAIEIKEEILIPKHPSLAISYNNMSNICQEKGHYKKAEMYQLRAIEIKEKEFPIKHSSLATSNNNKSNINQIQGEYRKTTVNQQKALEMKKEVLPVKTSTNSTNIHQNHFKHTTKKEYNDRFIVKRCNTRLSGKVVISGSRNSALAVLSASILSNDVCVIKNVPNINDVTVLIKTMEMIGVKIKKISANIVEVDSRNISNKNIGPIASKIRASYYLLGVLLGKYNEAEIAFPGGSDFGSRPIDQHIKGFEALGCNVILEHGMIKVKAECLVGSKIALDTVSVGATINIMLAASLGKGMTIIENCAKEPQVVDVANFLNSMGADIKGAGMNVIRIKGVSQLHGIEYCIIPDPIEAGTYMIAGAITGGDVTVTNIIPKHLQSISTKLTEMGATINEYGDAIQVICNRPLNNVFVKTLPYPGFPTDLQPQMVALLLSIKGTSIMTDSIFIQRFQYANELQRMGANIQIEGNTSIIIGGNRLIGLAVTALDMSAGMALIIAGLVANGETIVYNPQHIDKGYEDIVKKLNGIGANIIRISEKHDNSYLTADNIS